MFCSKCGNENVDAAKFCKGCGAPLVCSGESGRQEDARNAYSSGAGECRSAFGGEVSTPQPGTGAPGIQQQSTANLKTGGMRVWQKALIPCGAVAVLIIILFAAGVFGTTKVHVSGVGDRIEFGTWNGNPIKWRVLEVQDGKALVLSEDVLALRQYDGLEKQYGARLADVTIDWKNVNVTWADSEIRTWLNDDFLSEAFSFPEKFSILTSKISNPDNAEYGTEGSADTEDKVFLLSIDEAYRYFNSDEDRAAACVLTQEAIDYFLKILEEDYGRDKESLEDSRIEFENSLNQREACWWWLRSPGYFRGLAACVYDDGGVGDDGNDVTGGHGVRPALWISIA